MKPGFYYTTLQRKIVPGRTTADLKSGWHISVPALRDTRELVQINKKFILSIGCHLTHGVVLISKTHAIPHGDAVKFCDYLSFLLDTPACVLQPYKKGDKKQFSAYYKGMETLQRLKGFSWNKESAHSTYFSNLQSAFSAAGDVSGDNFRRELPVPKVGNGKVISVALPKSEKLDRAIHVYRQALISIEPSGQFLNYWRTIEAVTGTNQNIRLDLLKDFKRSSLDKIMAVAWGRHGNKGLNLSAKYKRLANNRLRQLESRLITSEKVLNYLYEEGRNPSAHADFDILRPTASRSLADIHRDIILLKCLARLAVERFWQSVCTP